MTSIRNFLKKITILFLLSLCLSGCSQIENFFQKIKNRLVTVNVRCISYSGYLQVLVIADGLDTKHQIGFIKIQRYNKPDLQSAFNNTDSFEFTYSGAYKDAYFIQDNSKGLLFILMPDKLHGIVSYWKDVNGNDVIPKEFPVLCFKSGYSS